MLQDYTSNPLNSAGLSQMVNDFEAMEDEFIVSYLLV